jgi:hypothetical protein
MSVNRRNITTFRRPFCFPQHAIRARRLPARMTCVLTLSTCDMLRTPSCWATVTIRALLAQAYVAQTGPPLRITTPASHHPIASQAATLHGPRVVVRRGRDASLLRSSWRPCEELEPRALWLHCHRLLLFPAQLDETQRLARIVVHDLHLCILQTLLPSQWLHRCAAVGGIPATRRPCLRSCVLNGGRICHNLQCSQCGQALCIALPCPVACCGCPIGGWHSAGCCAARCVLVLQTLVTHRWRLARRGNAATATRGL